ncbi:MAG: LysR family transcriptional regulator [Pseudomonadales bacterium]
MDWNDYHFFLVVARTPSVRAAAAELNVSHSTVLRRVENLENRLGARLFERQTVGFRLTPAGEEVFAGACDIEESIQSIDRAVTGRDSSLEGLVKISMPAVFSHRAVCPDFLSFKEQFPGIKLEVDLSYVNVNLNKREADIAVRFTRSPPEDLVGRRVGRAAMAPYATKKYVKKHKPMDAQSSAQLIGYGNPDTWRALAGFEHLDVAGFYDDIFLQVDLTKRGFGIGTVPIFMCASDPNLVQLAPPAQVFDVWVLYHTDLRYTSRVRAVRDFLVPQLTERLSAVAIT